MQTLIEVTIKDTGKHIEINLLGQLSSACIGDFTSPTWRHIENRSSKPVALVLDMANVSAVDSTGLATLIHLHNKVAPVFIHGPQETVATMLDRVGLTRVFHVFKTLDELKESEAWKALSE